MSINEKLFDDERNPRFGREYDLDEACEKLGISVKTYKLWERNGLISQVRRNPVTGYRVLSYNDIARLRRFIEKRKKNPRSRLGVNKKEADKKRH